MEFDIMIEGLGESVQDKDIMKVTHNVLLGRAAASFLDGGGRFSRFQLKAMITNRFRFVYFTNFVCQTNPQHLLMKRKQQK
jgi:hypothetical protein